MWKRLVSFILAYCFVISMAMPAGAAEKNLGFLTNSAVYSQQVDNGLVDEQGALLSGGISLALEKTADGPNRYDISLDLMSRGRGDNALQTASVLLIDTSYAAVESGRLNINIAAAKQFIQRTLTEGSPHEIALLVCHETTWILAHLTGTEGKEQLMVLLDTLPLGAGLYLEQGMREAAKELASSQSTKQQIILFTDGETTYSTKVAADSVHLSPLCDENCLGQVKTKNWRYDLSYVPEGTRVGNASGGFGADLYLHRVDYDIAPCQFDNQSHQWNIRTFPQNHGDTVIYEAEKIRNKGISIAAFAAGASATSDGGKLLQAVSNGGLALVGGYDSLLTALTPAPLERGFTKGEISLSLGDYLVVDTPSISFSQGTVLEYKESTSSVVWELGEEEKASFSFTVELAVEHPNFHSETPLFSKGSFRYADMEGDIKHLGTPNMGLEGSYSTLEKVGVWVDSTGGYRSEQGTVVPDPADAKQISPPVELLNSDGVNRWGITPEFSVSGDGIVPEEDYIPHPDSGTQLVGVSEVGTARTVYFPFVETNLSYIVEHYYEGDVSPFHEETVSRVDYGTVVTKLIDSPQLAVGYHRVETQIHPATVVSGDSVFRAVYAPDDQQREPYYLLFYQDDEYLEQEEESVPLANPQVTIAPDPNRYTGYRLGTIVFGDREDSVSLSGIITATENQFHLYYNSDLTQTLPYVIEYYEDDQKYDTENSSVWVGNPIAIVSPPLKNSAESKLVAVEFGGNRDTSSMTGHITPQDFVFRVYYETQEPEDWPYHIYYFFDGIKEETETKSVPASNPRVRVRPEPLWNGYQLEKIMYEGMEETTVLSTVITKEKNEIFVYYKIDYTQLIQYKINHYYDGVLDDALTSQSNIPQAHNTVTEVDYYEKSGYDFDYTTPQLPTSIGDGETIQIHYKRDLRGEYDYTIRYYKDGVLVSGETAYGRVPMANPSITIHPNPSKFSGYTLESVGFAGTQGKLSLTGIISDTDNTFDVFYVSEQVPVFSYQVDYYYDYLWEASASEFLSVSASSSQILVVPDKNRAGFSPAKTATVPELPHIILSDGEVISVYYVSDETETPPPISPPDAESMEIPVGMEFYNLNKLEGIKHETIEVPVEQRIVVGGVLGTKEYENQQYVIEEILISEIVRESSEWLDDSLTEAPPNPTLGASEVKLGQSTTRLGQSGANQGEQREKTSEQQKLPTQGERHSYRLNQYDVFFFTKGNQYELEVIYRLEKMPPLTTLPPPPVEEKVPIALEKTKTKSELPDKSSPPPTQSVVVKGANEKVANDPQSGQVAKKQLKLPQTGGTEKTEWAPSPIALITLVSTMVGMMAIWVLTIKKEAED